MHLEFHGAARTVTGSRHLLVANGHRILLDCGLFQGRRKESDRLNRDFGFAPSEVDAVIMSHAHIDHSGALPSLVKHGFKGNVHATLATADLMGLMLKDSAYIQEKDAEFLNKRRARRKEGRVEPLYILDDAERTMKLVEGHPYHRPIEISPGVTATFYDAGHILGSAVVELKIEENGDRRTLVFTGDLGRKNVPILKDPETPPEADALIIESTYGNREHKPKQEVEERLARLIDRVFARKGKLIVPAFSVGRTQELVYTISRLMRAGRVPGCCVYVDSPLAVNVTEVFDRHPETYDEEIRRILKETGDPFGFDLLEYVRSVDESKALNDQEGPFVVISASGMLEAGRVLHHLRNSIEDPENVILIVGYQAAHTLGRKLVDGAKEVRIFGEMFKRRAEVVVMNEFSAHADRNELMAWMDEFKRGPGQVFVVHGEESQSQAFARTLKTDRGFSRVEVPKMHERFEF